MKPTIEAFKMRPKRGEAFEAFEAFRSSSDCVDLICSLWNSAAGWAQCIGQKKRSPGGRHPLSCLLAFFTVNKELSSYVICGKARQRHGPEFRHRACARPWASCGARSALRPRGEMSTLVTDKTRQRTTHKKKIVVNLALY